jgi:hypothetical protein
MAAQTSGSEPQVTGQVMFYKQIEPLSAEKHRTLGAKQIERPFSFLADQDVVPLTVNEFPFAGGSYPIIFAGPEKMPLAVMGIRGGENLFVANGEVDPEVYLPAFVRRYPFVFATDQNGSGDMLVCIDRLAPMIGENTEAPFFIGDQPSQFMANAIEFLKEFDLCGQATQIFVKTLMDMDLFEKKQTVISNVNEKGESAQVTADYYAVSEEKLVALPADKFNALREMNMIGPIYAHLVSLLSWPRVLYRAAARDRAGMPLAAFPIAASQAASQVAAKPAAPPMAATPTPPRPVSVAPTPPREPPKPPEKPPEVKKKKGLFG